jgi:uncharacterized protein YndB with AHSA1/START domain
VHDDQNGEVTESNGRRVLRFVRRFPAAPAEVWSAITEPERMARWAYPGTIELRVGGAVRFDYGEQGEGNGVVLACVENSLLEYEWGEGSDQWHIRYDLVDDGEGGTVLTFDHFLPDPSNAEFAAGWHWHLERLGEIVVGRETADVQSDDRFLALMEMYSSR